MECSVEQVGRFFVFRSWKLQEYSVDWEGDFCMIKCRPMSLAYPSSTFNLVVLFSFTRKKGKINCQLFLIFFYKKEGENKLSKFAIISLGSPIHLEK